MVPLRLLLFAITANPWSTAALQLAGSRIALAQRVASDATLRSLLSQGGVPSSAIAAACTARMRELIGDDPEIIAGIIMNPAGAPLCSSGNLSTPMPPTPTLIMVPEVQVVAPVYDRRVGAHVLAIRVPIRWTSGKHGRLELRLRFRPEKASLGTSRERVEGI